MRLGGEIAIIHDRLMATVLRIPLTEYFGTDCRPDRAYADGEIRERNVPQRMRYSVAQGSQMLYR